MTRIKISKHAKDRLKSRLGVKKSNQEEFVQRVYDKGNPPEGFSLKFQRELNIICDPPQVENVVRRVYNGSLFIFSRLRGTWTLITVLSLPESMKQVTKKSNWTKKV